MMRPPEEMAIMWPPDETAEIEATKIAAEPAKARWWQCLLPPPGRGPNGRAGRRRRTMGRGMRARCGPGPCRDIRRTGNAGNPSSGGQANCT